MGKPGKKAGDEVGPSTNVNRTTASIGKQTHLRSQRKLKVLKMYNSRIKRDPKTGQIVSGSVLSAADRVERTMARIAPDRRWFGNTRVIGANALQTFRDEMKAKQNDPYSVVLKQSKLPLSLLDEPKNSTSVTNEMRYADTFGKKSIRKRVKLAYSDLGEMKQTAGAKSETYGDGGKDRQLVRHQSTSGTFDDMGTKRKLFEKGQSARIWGELFKVIDSSDVILYVVDARDPSGTRSQFIEDYIRKEKRYKHFVFVLNKCDLVPSWSVARWLQILSKDHPTVAMHSSTTNPFGKGNLINLLRQFSRLHNVTNKPSAARQVKNPISVGVIGYPNVGKSSVINTLRRKKVCKVAPIPGETKIWQYVMLTRSIYLIDCPGVVYDREGNNDVQAVLKGVVRVERMGNVGKDEMVTTVLEIVKHKDIEAKYGVQKWKDTEDFLCQVALKQGRLLQGGIPNTDAVARNILYDWQRGVIPWFNAPPFESNQKFRDAVNLPEAQHLKFIQNYASFNIVDDRIVQSMYDDDAKRPAEDEDDEEDKVVSDDEDVHELEQTLTAKLNAEVHTEGADDDVVVDDTEGVQEEEEEEQPQKKKNVSGVKALDAATKGSKKKAEKQHSEKKQMQEDEDLWNAVMAASQGEKVKKAKVVRKKSA